MSARDHLGPQFPVSSTGELYHGTNDIRAASIERDGFTGPTAYFAPTAKLAASYAQGRVAKDGGQPVVLRADPLTGVSSEHTGYSSPDKNRAAGADFMPGHSETIVLHPHKVRGIRRL